MQMRRPTSAPYLEPNEDSKDNNVTFLENMSEIKGFLQSRKKSLSLKTQQRMYVTTLRTLTVLRVRFRKRSSACTYIDRYVDDFADLDYLNIPFSKEQQRMYVRRHVRRRLCGL